jgi:hypothetical protein
MHARNRASRVVCCNARRPTWVCEIPFSHGGEYEGDRFLGYSAMLSRWSRPTFQRCKLPSSGRHDKGTTYIWNVGLLQRDYMALYPIKLSSSTLVSSSSPWEPQISYTAEEVNGSKCDENTASWMFRDAKTRLIIKKLVTELSLAYVKSILSHTDSRLSYQASRRQFPAYFCS